MKVKSKLIPFLGLFTVGLLLALAIGANAAPGDPPFTLTGLLNVVGTDFSVKGQSFIVVDDMVTTKCTDLALTTVSCSTLNGKLVEVEGYISQVDAKYYATSITEEPPATLFDYTGELKAFSDTVWKIDSFDFKVGPTTIVPPFYAISDTVVSTYTVDATLGDYLAKEFKVLKSSVGSSYAYTGTLKTVNGDLWTVDTYDFVVSSTVQPPFFALSDTVKVDFTILDSKNVATKVTVLASGEGNEYKYVGELTAFTPISWTVGAYTFILGENITLPPYFGLYDTVEVTFKIVDGDFVATALRVVDTNVGAKVESSRCENRLKDHPGVLKFARDLHEDPVKIKEYFCLGFGLGEIKLAYRYAEGTGFTPAMLLAMRASGMDWDEIKQLIAGKLAGEESVQQNSVSNGKMKNQDQTANSSTGTSSNNDRGNHGKAPDKGKSDHGKKK